MNREPVKIICQIIKDFMQLDSGQIWIYNQDYKIPNTTGLFVIVSLLGTRPYGLRQNEIENQDGSMSEEQTLNAISQYQIDIQSKDNSARLRKEEVLFALTSNLSQQLQEQYFFRIAKIPNSFENTSLTEEPSMYTKFSLTLNVFSWNKNVKNIDYYNNPEFNLDKKED